MTLPPRLIFHVYFNEIISILDLVFPFIIGNAVFANIDSNKIIEKNRDIPKISIDISNYLVLECSNPHKY